MAESETTRPSDHKAVNNDIQLQAEALAEQLRTEASAKICGPHFDKPPQVMLKSFDIEGPQYGLLPLLPNLLPGWIIEIMQSDTSSPDVNGLIQKIQAKHQIDVKFIPDPQQVVLPDGTRPYVK